jgi:polar amino acid transport system substrate-binding protein
MFFTGKIINLKFVLCLFTVLTVALPVSVGQTQTLKDLPLATVEFPPFHYKNGDRVSGFITEIVEATFLRIGYAAKIDVYPSKRGKNLAESGKLAGIFAFTKKPERLKKYHFTSPVGTIRDVFFKRKDRDISWAKMEDLQSYIIGATDTYNYSPIFMRSIRDGVINTEMIVSQTPEVLHLRKLAGKRIDLAICEISLCSFIIRKSAPAFDSLDYIDKAIGSVRTFHLGISRNWPGAAKLTREFDAALVELEDEGVIAEIHKRYGIVPYKE